MKIIWTEEMFYHCYGYVRDINKMSETIKKIKKDWTERKLYHCYGTEERRKKYNKLLCFYLTSEIRYVILIE